MAILVSYHFSIPYRLRAHNRLENYLPHTRVQGHTYRVILSVDNCHMTRLSNVLIHFERLLNRETKIKSIHFAGFRVHETVIQS